MGYRLVTDEPPRGVIEHVTFVAFLPSGACAALPGPTLISGAVLPGESIRLDASARIPLETAGFFRQQVRVFAVDGTHAYAWLNGDRYTGQRPHAATDLEIAEPDRLAGALDRRGLPLQAQAVRDAVRLSSALDDNDYYADVVQLLEPAYLRADTPEAGSGFGGTAEQWRASREMIVDGIDRGECQWQRRPDGRAVRRLGGLHSADHSPRLIAGQYQGLSRSATRWIRAG